MNVGGDVGDVLQMRVPIPGAHLGLAADGWGRSR